MNRMGLTNSIPADVSSIERELQQQWRIHASTQPVLRTRTLNLVIVSLETQTPAELVQQVTCTYPCRVVVLEQTHDASKLHATVSTSCAWAQSGASCLVREEVRLLAPTRLEGGRIESLVVPLLVSDVPVFLWWRGRPDFEDELLLRLASHADRVVLDSSEYASAWSGLAEIAHAIRAPSWRAAIADLAWARVTVWRELITQFFNNRQCGEHPGHVRLVRIAHGGEQLPVDALVLGVWIARQLGWNVASETRLSTPARSGASRLVFQQDGERSEIVFHSDGFTTPGLAIVELIAEGMKEGVFTVAHTSDHRGLVTVSRIGAQEQVQRTVRSRTLSLADMIVRELSLTGRDALYEQVVTMVGNMEKHT